MEELLPFLIVCPFVFLAGLVDAIAGGGGLISLPGYIIAGLPIHTVLGTNKLSSCMGTALATFRFAKQGFIQAKRAVPCAIAALFGGAAGAGLALLIADEVFRIIMVVVLPLTAIYLMRSHSLDVSKESPTDKKTIALCAVIAFALGIYDGVYGPGTGTFLMLAFTGLAHLTLNDAAGTAKVVNLTTNLASLTVFLISGNVWLVLGLIAGAFNMMGAWVGVNLFTDKGVKIVKPVMFAVMAIFMIKVIFDLVAG